MANITKRKRFKPLTVFDRAVIGQKYKSKELGFYRADVAHQKALEKRGKRGARPRLKNDEIRAYAAGKMKLGWSPEQISLRLPIDNPGQTISHEAIYEYVYTQIRRDGNGTVKEGCEDLRKYLARRHKRRQKKGFRKAQKLERNGRLPSIEDRPKEADKRKEIGHFEDDPLVSRQSVVRLKSINERASGVVFLGKMSDGTGEESARVVCERLSALPSYFRKTLTRDRLMML